MSSRKIILLSLALLVGAATFVVFRSSQAPQPVAQAPVETTEVLAAARDLPTGTILKEIDMKWIPWASTAENSKLYVKGKADMSALFGAVLRESMRADEPILVGRAVQPHEQGFLAAVLTPGMRAISVALSPSSEVAGFIFPGDRVDVILTHTFSRKDISVLTERHVSETVLTNVRVLALDQKSDNQSTDPKVAATATLEVTPRQAEKLVLAADLAGTQAASHGTISLALRSLAVDDASASSALSGAAIPLDNTAPSPVWDSDVSPAYPTVNGEDGLTQKVQIMRGKDMTETTFERHRSGSVR
jgi:pilus assembly protein CpaB